MLLCVYPDMRYRVKLCFTSPVQFRVYPLFILLSLTLNLGKCIPWILLQCLAPFSHTTPRHLVWSRGVTADHFPLKFEGI